MKRLSVLLFSASLLGATVLLGGCATIGVGKKPTSALVVPVCKNAQEQFAYAKTYQGSQMISSEDAKRREQLDRIIQCYESVITNFPDDRVFTPVAYLEIADSVAHRGEFKRAVTMYEAAYTKWPEIDYIQARSLLSTGRLLDGMGEYEKAKDKYAELRTKFADSKSQRVAGMVKAADAAYFKMHEKNRKKK